MAPDRRVGLAKAFQFQGRTADAERLYREVLAGSPNVLDALEGLGVLLFHRGSVDEAAKLFARGAAIDPSLARFHANLGEALRTLHRLDEALTHLRKAISLDPASVQGWNSLGLVAFEAHRLGASQHAYREAIRLDPRFVHAYINLANTLLALGQPREAAAELRTGLAADPNNVIALVNLSRIVAEIPDSEFRQEAEAAARRAIELAPRMPLALKSLARVLGLKGDHDQAADLEQRARAIESNARIQANVNDPRVEADRRPPAASGVRPAQALSTKGQAHLAEGQLDQAERSLRESLELDATIVDSWLALATIDAQRGQFDRSCQSARAALAVRPDTAEAHWRLASNLLGQLPDTDIAAMEHFAWDESRSNDERALLHFGLGLVNDRRGQFDKAAAHHDLANRHQAAGKRARGLAHDPDRHSWYIDQIIAAFSEEFLDRRRRWGVPDPRPVFVVGFPRSGTTLVEQIVAAHPQVHGAGELLELHYIFQSLPAHVGLSGGNAFDALPLLSPVSAQALASRYLDRLRELAPATVARVVDKMPDNVIQLGLVAILFPKAKVIVCHRDPRDVALSCWQTGFRTSSWNNDWNHIARRLADYQRIVRHWTAIRAVESFDVRYQDLVTDPERNAQALIAYLGLSWNPACLDFQSSPLAIRTPSLVQVRQPIHARSCGRWKNYRGTLEPMFAAFERHGVEIEGGD